MSPAGAPDPDEFERTALIHLDSVARFALSLTRNDVDADDLVQETFLRAFRGWHTFTEGTDCRRWLFTICRNTFIRMATRSARYVLSEEGDLDAWPAVKDHMEAVQAGMPDAFDLVDVQPAIERAVKDLPEPHHSILVLVDLEDMSYEEAAAILEIPVGTVRSRLYRARRQVQAALLGYAADLGIGPNARATPPNPERRISGLAGA
jgi:RNA polymerase sigma-70 factor (ECF subfamily)